MSYSERKCTGKLTTGLPGSFTRDPCRQAKNINIGPVAGYITDPPIDQGV